jgi:hypothetical protein
MRLVKLLTLVVALVALRSGHVLAADCSADPGDADGDGICDAHDPCVGLGNGAELREATLKLRRLGGRANDDTLRFRAIVPLNDEAVDPAATGLRLVVLDAAWTSDDVVLDLTAPAGPEWVTTSGGWTYRSTDVGTSDIKRAVVKEIDPNPAYARTRALSVSIDARRGAYDSTSDLESHYVTLAFAAAGTAEVCANRPFYPWLFTGVPGVEDPYEAPEWAPECRFRSNGRTLDCTSGPRVGVCQVSLPNDLLVCDVQNAAAAQEQYAMANAGAYFDGPCEALPGFTASPNVTCAAHAADGSFWIETSSPNATWPLGCRWESSAMPHLSCS